MPLSSAALLPALLLLLLLVLSLASADLPAWVANAPPALA
jgi:hypothetical protein